jgi:hypothetical protein
MDKALFALQLLSWSVEADSSAEALAQLPPWVAERTATEPVSSVALP